MSISRVHVWASAETLYASDLNTEFNNILNYLNASPIVAVDALTKTQGDMLQWRANAWANRSVPQISSDMAPQGYISGLTLSTAGSSSTFGIAAGLGVDSTAALGMTLTTAFTKTTSTWAVGTANGALDTGSIANSTWYHAYLIMRPDTGLVDILISLSASAPTMPSNYTLKRRIGAMKTDGSAHWTPFIQIGDEFLWASPAAHDINANVTTAPAQSAVNVPPGIKVLVRLVGWAQNAASTNTSFNITSPESSVTTVTNTNAATVSMQSGAGGVGAIQNFVATIYTDASQNVNLVATDDSASNLIRASAFSWIDPRGKP